jgi:hypothetical protein
MPPAIEALKSQMMLTGNMTFPAKIYDIERQDKSFRKESLRFVSTLKPFAM